MRPRIILTVCIVVSTVFLFIAGNNVLRYYQTLALSQDDVAILFHPPASNLYTSHNSKLIFVWTHYFGDQNWDFMPLGKSAFTNCPVQNCYVTANSSYFLQSDAVVFHARDLVVTELPRLRLPAQRWVFFSLESPHYSYFSGFKVLDGVFNWTMTYRKDSDITLRYGEVLPFAQPKKWFLTEEDWRSKNKMVVWMVSHCNTASQREKYTNEMQKYISVDVYGKCGKIVCPANHTSECLESFSKKYKFYLAFENSICKDYVTEKFFTALKYSMIPIVLGGADYKSIAPPNSFIDALSFSSPKKLATYLYKVASDYKLYSSYMEWKSFYYPNLVFNHCDLCAKLHSVQKSSTVHDLRGWWVEESKCNNWENFLR